MSTHPTVASGPHNTTLSVATSTHSDTKSSSTVLLPIIIGAVVILLIIVAFLLPKTWRLRLAKSLTLRAFRSGKPVLPVTENEQPHKTFLQRRLEYLSKWRKPAVPPTPPERCASAHRPNTAGIPTLSKPAATVAPRGPGRLNYQQWLERYRNRSPGAEERHRFAREEWMPTMPTLQDQHYWQQVSAQQQARRTVWERLRERFGI